MFRLKTSTGFSSKMLGLWWYAYSMSRRSGRTQLEPFSTGVNRKVGKREHRPCPTSEEIVSMIGRPA
jgi:hypothetical protein